MDLHYKWMGDHWAVIHDGRVCPYETKVWKAHPGHAVDPRAELAHFQATSARIAERDARFAEREALNTRYRYKVDHDILSPEQYGELCVWSIEACAELGCPAAIPLPYREVKDGEDYDLADEEPFSGSYTIRKEIAGHPVIYVRADQMDTMRRTTAHEVAHVWQHYAKVPLTRDQAEVHADALADRLTAKLHRVEPEYEPGYMTYRPGGIPILPCQSMGGARIAGGYTRAYKVFPVGTC